MNTKKVVLGIVLGCFGLIALVAIGGYFVARSVLGPVFGGGRGGAHLGAARVVSGEGVLCGSPFLSDASLGSVTDIKPGKVDAGAGVVAAVAGEEGAAFVTGDGSVVSSVSFGDRFDHVEVVDVEGDGVCEFLNRGSWGSDPALLAHDGRVLWSYRAPDGADDTCAGDVDGDGRLEFALGCNGGGGVHLIGADGRQRWRQSGGNVWHVEMADVDGSGALRILHSSASGDLTVRDGRGNILHQTNLRPVYLSHFAVCAWPSPPPAVLAPGGGIIGVYDASGTLRTSLKAPDATDMADIWATPVALRAGAPAYLAATLVFSEASKSVLYVYDSAGSLVYQEVLPGRCEAVAALPLGTGAEALLVGGEGTVTKYAWTGGAAAQ
jgi:hypothetical protein